MKVFDYNTLPATAGETKTMQELIGIIGQKPELAKEIVTLPEYAGLTALKLTEMLGGVFHNENKGLTNIETFVFDWVIDIKNNIPRIEFAEDCTETGEGGAEFVVVLKKRYYYKNEVMELENRQQLFVIREPTTVTPDKHNYAVRLVAGDYSKRVNTAFMTRNKKTRYLSNFQPEMSEKGYSRYMNNLEKHRGFINRHRVQESRSGDYSALGMKYVQVANGGNGFDYYKIPEMKKRLLDDLMLAVNNAMLFAETNYSDTFQCLIQEEDGRPIPIGEGVIPQIRRFCAQQGYNTDASGNLPINVLKNAMAESVSKQIKKTGHKLVMVCNYRLFLQVQSSLDAVYGSRIVAENLFLTKVDGGKLKVGATYAGYEFAGNQIILMEDAALTQRYTDKGFGVIINTLVETNNGTKVNVEQMTIKGAQLFEGSLPGFGGMSGYASGNVSSMIAANEYGIMAYRGVKVNDPYSAFILEEN